MVEFRKSIRFLSKADLDTLGLGMGDTIDYDSYVTDEAIQSMDLVLTDDYGQI